MKAKKLNYKDKSFTIKRTGKASGLITRGYIKIFNESGKVIYDEEYLNSWRLYNDFDNDELLKKIIKEKCI